MPCRSWLSETQWAQLKTLENMEAFEFVVFGL